MIVRCIHNTGAALRPYEYSSLQKEQFGRFGATENAEYGAVTIGKEYIVMGVIVFETYQAYLIDDDGSISTCPCQLFEVVDSKVDSNWHFRTVEKEEDIYPFIQAVWGYYELCYDKKTYENLIIEKDEHAQRIYFRRKIELDSNK